MAVVVWGGAQLAGRFASPGRAADWLVVLAVIPAGAAVYGVALWALRIEGREEIDQLLARVRARIFP